MGGQGRADAGASALAMDKYDDKDEDSSLGKTSKTTSISILTRMEAENEPTKIWETHNNSLLEDQREVTEC